MFFDQLVTELSTTLSVGALLFFMAVYFVVSLRAFRHGADELDERARMALNDGIEATRHETVVRG